MKRTKTLTKKIVCILLILLTIAPSLLQTISFAAEINEAYLESRAECEWHVQYWNADKNVWSYITCTFVTYNYNGKEYPAYCLNREYPGVGEMDGYSVDIDSVLDNNQIWRVVKNGYPYQSPSAMGVHDKYDAFVATKQAAYCILYGFDPTTRYRGADDRGTAIANAICNLVNIGRNGSETPANAGVTVNTAGTMSENDNYYIQKYNVSTAVECSQYTITGSSGLPNGSKITDTSGNEKSTFNGGSQFQVMIPKTSITKDINAVFAIQAKCKTYPIFYGRTRIAGTQNYAVTYDPFGDSEGIGKLNIKAEGKLNLSKISADNNIWTGTLKGQGVPNAIYTIKNSNGEKVKDIKTGNDGNINITLPVGSYTLVETSSPNYFLKDNKEYSFTISYMGDNATINIKENVEEGGYFSAKKTSSLNNIWTGHKVNDPVAGATYGLYTLDGKIVEVDGVKAIKTSTENGVIFDKFKMKLGDYYMQEIEPAPHFYKDETKYYFKVEKNEQSINIDVQNRPIEGAYVNIFKSSLGNNLWTGTFNGEGVANATYRIESLTVDGWYIDVTTNEKGKIVEKQYTSDNIELLLGKYKIYEISSPERMEIE